VPRPSGLGLPRRYRQHALARLDAVIASTERERDERQETFERLTRAKKGATRAKARLRVAEYRLALLHNSRRWLAEGAPPVD
jgi:hypothetical protein